MQFSTMVWLARSYRKLQRAADSLDLMHFATMVGVQRRRTSRVLPGIGLALLGAAGGAGAALLFAPSSGAKLRARLLGAPGSDEAAADVKAAAPVGVALESPPGAAPEPHYEVAPRSVPESMIVPRGVPDPLEVDLLEGVFMGASESASALPTVQHSVKIPPATGADDEEVLGPEDMVLNWMSRATQAGHSLSEADLAADPDNVAAEAPEEEELEIEVGEEVWPAERARSRA